MGLLVGYFAFSGAIPAGRLFLTTGILGGYTTFSAFSLDTALLYERGELGLRRFMSSCRSRSRRPPLAGWRRCSTYLTGEHTNDGGHSQYLVWSAVLLWLIW